MRLQPGARLGPYEIAALIGAGGMGVVYRARDTRLRRQVAIKVLPDEVAVDRDRIDRFEREARALAALHHPRVASLFGIEEADGRHYLVMELVEGETLAERVRARALSLDDALRFARQIAEALEAAHDKGIIHRDLKPANIKITAGDNVKVLDFGLAKAIDSGSAGNVEASFTTHASIPTESGVILGTPAYMSPEQARGKPVDRRADVWAFGCVLFEMLTGKRAFAGGESVSDTIAAVLTSEVNWSALPAAVPPRIRTLLRRCLLKDVQKRLPHIALARLEIEDDAADSPHAPAASPPSRRWTRSIAPVVIAAASASLAAVAAWTFKPPTVPVLTRFSMTLPEDQAFTNTGRQAVTVSPDGSHIVYVANSRLFARTLGDETPRAIPGAEHEGGVLNPVFSPDGQSLAFVAGSELKRVPFAGGIATAVAPVNGGVYGLSWSGEHLIFGEGGIRILRVPVAGGTPEVLITVAKPEVISSPSMLPDGRHLLFSHSTFTNPEERWTKARVVVQSLETGQRTTIIEGGADGRYLPSGHLVYATGGIVYGAPFDVDRLAILGTPSPVIEGLRRGGPTGAAQFAVSSTGSLAYLPGTPSSPLERELILTDPGGEKAVRLKVRGGEYEHPRLSPDGARVVFGSSDPKLSGIWVYELSGVSAMRRLALEGNSRYPVWSGDGERVVFQSDREGDAALYWQRADGTGTAERLTRPDAGMAHIPHSASPDGRHLAFSITKGGAATLSIYSFVDRKVEQVPGVSSTVPLEATFSPDGRFVLYASIESAGAGSRIFVMPFPFNGTRYQVGGGLHPTWSHDGRRVFSPRTQGLMGVITIEPSPVFRFTESIATAVRAIGASGIGRPREYDVGRNGAIVSAITAGNLDALRDNREIRVVLNWNQELQRLVPTR